MSLPPDHHFGLQSLPAGACPNAARALLLATLFAGCGGGAELLLPGDGQPARIEVVHGDSLSGRVGEPLSDSLVFEVTDSRRRPIEGVRIAFELTSAGPGADVLPDTAQTDANGRTYARMVLGTTIGPQEGEARVVAPEGTDGPATSFRVIALSENANGIVALSGDNQTWPAGAALPQPLVVQVTDAFGNPIAGVPINWTAEGGGSVSEASNVTDADGRAAVQRTLGPTAGPQTTVATSEQALAGSPVVFAHNATPGNVSGLSIISGNDQTAQVSSRLPADLVVQLVDAAGNGVPGSAVTWVVATGGGSVTPQNGITDPAGHASAQWTLGPNPGENRLDAVVSGVGVVNFTATGTAAAPASLAIVTQPSSVARNGQLLERQPVIQVRDVGGNNATTPGIAVTAQLSGGGGVLLGTRQRLTDGSGRATFTDLAIAGVEGSRVLVFTAAGFGGASSTPIQVNAAPTSTTITSDFPDPSTAGGVVTVGFRVDAGGVIPIGSVSVTDGVQSCTGTLSAGSGSCQLALSTVGQRTLRATYSGTAGLTGSSATASHRVDPPPAGNTPPIARFSSRCEGLTCQFTDGSSDSDGSVIGWGWNFGDGRSTAEREPTHTFATSGRYNVTLIVTDDDGASSQTTAPVNVEAPPPPPPPPPVNQPPTAAFTSSCDQLTCAFNSDGSGDSDGRISSYLWTFGDGGTDGGRNPRHSYAVAGTYNVTLTVTDDDGATNSIAHQVTATPPPPPDNKAPHAEFEVSCTFMTCTFTDQSRDDDGTIVSRSWNYGDGSLPSNVPSHTYSTPGDYRVTLTVTDNSGGTDTRERDAKPRAPPPQNQAPTAVIGVSCTNLSCSFSSSASSDPDGLIVTRRWDFGDGSSSSDANPTHAYGAQGTYNVQLTVTDNDGAPGSAARAVTVAPAPNQVPTAAFSPNCPAVGLTCSFNSDASSDNDGSVVSRSWTFGDGTGSNERNPSHTYPSGGTYNVTLTVTDDDGATDSETKQVTVTAPPPPNQAPTAAFSSDCPSVGLTCSFNSEASSDDGTIVTRSWTFGDGSSSNERNPSHSYTAGGTYTVTLTVRDDDGVEDAETHQVTVTAPPPPNEAPSAAFTAPSCTVGEACQFNDASTDSDGQVVEWDWNFGEGPPSGERNPTHTYSASGTYTVTLRVRDDDGAQSNQVQHEVTVVDPTPPNEAPVAQIGSITCTGMHCEYQDQSTDPNGSETIEAYSWVFGDGNSSNNQNPSHDYATTGSYTVTLTVTDDDGLSDEAQQTISVEASSDSTGGTANLIAKGPNS